MKIKKEKILLFSKQFNSLTKAGINITQALDILILSETDKTFINILEKIKKNLNRGKNIFNSFKDYRDIFGNHFIYMLKVGEISGSLSMALDNIHNYLEYNLSNKKKITSLLIYPSIVFLLSLIIFIFLLVFILPNFMNLFEESQIEIPKMTKFLIFLSNNFHYFLTALLLIFSSIILILKHISSKKRLKFKKDKFILKLIILGDLLKLKYAEEIYYSLHILLNSGITLVDGFDVIVENTNNLEIKKNLLNIQKDIKTGATITSAFIQLNLFNKRFQSFIKTAEESGFLSEAFLEISKILKLEYEYKLKKYIAFIEPLSIIALGFFIVFIILSIYIPIFSMIDVF